MLREIDTTDARAAEPSSALRVWGAKANRGLRPFAREWRAGIHLRLSVVEAALAFVPAFAGGWVRSRAYRLIGIDVERSAFLMGRLQVRGGASQHLRNIHIGPNVRISTDVTLNCDAPIVIEENVTIGPYVRIYTTTHAIGPGSLRCDPDIVVGPVTIGRGTWIALGAMVLPGVTIGPGCVIGAGAVVSSDVPANSLVEGVPGRVVSTLPFGNR